MAAAGKIAVVTESIACLSEEEASRWGITVIPIPFEYAGKEYLDGVDITPEEFNKMLRPDLPPAVTSAPSPGTYMEEFCRLASEGCQVLCVSPTPAVTRMYEAAEQGRRLAQEERGITSRIEVVDCGTATMAQGFVALEAARLARGDATMEEILRRVRLLSSRVGLLVTLDTLEYLAKTSRIPRIGALFGKALQIKPIIYFGQGTVDHLDRPRSRRRAISRMLDLMEVRLNHDGPLHVAVQHANAREEAESLRGEVARRFSPETLRIAEFSPVMSSYTGPGLLGLAFYEDPEGHRA
ncbi:DegV family protein [Rubrobacter calidifluminis]|uniref:DegV family protein n=1 Tax=Rubrobacter calidifluminis TaxID=1392640 RepID=UPI0023603561|nr:DegV family protein [Rubrobacter calidifluminis]